MPKVLVKNFLGSSDSALVDYQWAWDGMRRFTRERSAASDDEIWLLEHWPVYTLGQAGDPSHVLDAQDIPVIKVDRGGQVTYHGPGQIMVYVLIDLRRYRLGVRDLVVLLEQAVVELLKGYGIEAEGNRRAPGVYVSGKKIAALGLRVSRGCSYHGICFNWSFDDAPFNGINPCGYQGMEVTQLGDGLTDLPSKQDVANLLVKNLAKVIFRETGVELELYS